MFALARLFRKNFRIYIVYSNAGLFDGRYFRKYLAEIKYCVLGGREIVLIKSVLNHN